MILASRRDHSRNLACWFYLTAVVITGGCATSPVRRSDPPPIHDGQSPGCDSDWDGALLGAAIGVSPMLIGSLSHGPGDGVPLGFQLGFVGGIAGFWIGLAIDSRNCEDPT